MTKSELLKLKPGIYLATDSICNYFYEIHKYTKQESLICQIKQRGQISFNTVGIHYNLIKEWEDDYDRHLPLMKMATTINIGGLSVHKDGAYDIYSSLYLIGLYSNSTFRKDVINYCIHHKINLPKYDKKHFKAIR